MIQIISWIWVFSGVLLILLVLLHSPKGDGMGGIAASGSSMFNSASSACLLYTSDAADDQ